MCAHAHTCTHNTHIHVQPHIYMHTHAHIHMHVRMHACKHTPTHAHMHTDMCTCMHTHMRAHVHMCAHMCTHTHTLGWLGSSGEHPGGRAACMCEATLGEGHPGPGRGACDRLDTEPLPARGQQDLAANPRIPGESTLGKRHGATQAKKRFHERRWEETAPDTLPPTTASLGPRGQPQRAVSASPERNGDRRRRHRCTGVRTRGSGREGQDAATGTLAPGPRAAGGGQGVPSRTGRSSWVEFPGPEGRGRARGPMSRSR